MIKASVIGWPISHSRSPLIHGHWLDKYKISGSYERIAVAPDQLQHFLDTLRTGDHIGTNVTIPHKESALAFVDEPDDRVRRIGALNTIWRQDGKLLATSTDGPGFYANLKNTLPDLDVSAKPVVILGAGGSARSLIDELLRQGVTRISLFNRTHTRAQALADYFGSAVIATPAADLPQSFTNCGLLINTTSTGMNDEGQLQLPWDQLPQTTAVADIVYTPLVTALLKTAEARGHPIVTGLGMLLHQAVIGFEKWFGVLPEVTPELYHLVARDIDPGYQP